MLRGQQLTFTITGDDGVPFDGIAAPLMHFSLALVRVSSAPKSSRESMLRGSMDFDIDGRFQTWSAGDDEFLNYTRRHEIVQRIQTSPASHATILERVRQAGVRFGPDAKGEVEKIARFVFRRLESHIGRAESIESGFFPWTAVAWTVDARTDLNGRRERYTLLLEAFEGKPIALVVMPWCVAIRQTDGMTVEPSSLRGGPSLGEEIANAISHGAVRHPGCPGANKVARRSLLLDVRGGIS